MIIKKSKYATVVACSVGGMICVRSELEKGELDELAEIRLNIKNDFVIDFEHGFGPYFRCELYKDDLDVLAVDWLTSRYGCVPSEIPNRESDESLH